MNVKLEKMATWRPTAEEPKPRLDFVSALARRRLTMLERAAIAAAYEVWPEGEELPVVFASRWGEVCTTEKLMRQFHDEGEMSPAAFAVSVHNAAPGAFSIFTNNHAPYTAIAARTATFDAGMLEAAAMRCRVLFVYVEETAPELYRPEFPDETGTFAVAMLMDGSAS